MSFITIIEGIGKFITFATAAGTLSETKSGKRAAEMTLKAGKKIKKKVTRTDDDGIKQFKYNAKKLSALFSKDKITEEAYDYLYGELKHISIFCTDCKNFEKLFERIMKAKDPKKIKTAIEKYEKIRYKYLT